MKFDMKKVVSLAVSALLLASLAACGQGTEAPVEEGAVKTEEPVAVEKSVRPEGEAIKVSPALEETRGEYQEGDIVVSPEGSDKNPGTLEEPLATLTAAKEKAKGIEGSERVVVWLRAGTYFLDEALTFTDDDRANVSYKAYGGEDAVISAGRPVTGWTVEKVNGVVAWTASVDETFTSLYKEDAKLTLARYPDEGAANMLVATVSSADAARPGYNAFYLNPADIAGLGDITGARVRTYHYWAEDNHTVIGYNAANGKVSMDTASSYAIFKNDPCVIEGIRAALSVPGEWYLDTTAMKVYYIPFEGDDIDSTVLYYSKLDLGVDITGASGLTFEGIRFSYSGYDPQYCGYSFQAAIQIPGFLEIKSSDKVAFRDCAFYGIGLSAITLRSDADNVEVSGCLFQDIGGSGVAVRGNVYKIMQKMSEITASQTPENILITNNLISDYGRIFNSATGVQVMAGANVEISHNEITGGEYSGVSAGWVWGYSYQPSNNITISDNLIHDIGGRLGDMGGIYTLGPLPGTFITGNVVYNISCGENTYGGWGIYTDEGSTGITISNNFAFGCSDESFHQHYGRENLIKNNIFVAYEGFPLAIDPDHPDEEHIVMFIDSNLLVINSKPVDGVRPRSKLFSTTDIPYEGYNIEVSGNIYWDIGSDPQFDTIRKLIENNSPMYIGGICADPQFSEDLLTQTAEIPDAMPSADADIYSTGFTTWDYSGAGTAETIAVRY